MNRLKRLFGRRPERAVTQDQVRPARTDNVLVEAKTRSLIGQFVSEAMRVERNSIEIREALARGALQEVTRQRR